MCVEPKIVTSRVTGRSVFFFLTLFREDDLDDVYVLSRAGHFMLRE